MTIMELPPSTSQVEAVRQPERYELPAIVAEYDDPKTMDRLPPELRPASITEVIVDDPYIKYLEATNPALLRKVRAHEKYADADAGYRREMGEWDRRRDTAYQTRHGEWREKEAGQWGDPESSSEFFGDGAHGVKDLARRHGCPLRII